MLARAELNCVRHGRGPEVFVGLHGWSGSHRSFEPLWDRVPESASFYSFDLPGFGASPDPARWDIDGFLEPLESELNAWEGPPMTLVGACGGAVVALFLALRMGPKVNRLVMIDPFANVPWYFRIFRVPVIGPLLYALVFMNPAGRILTNWGLRSRRTDDTDLIEGFRDVRHASNLAYLGVLLACAEVEFSSFGRFRGQVDIVYGSRTFGAVRSSVPRWRSVWPALSAHELAGAGHLPIFEATDGVAEVVFGDRAA